MLSRVLLKARIQPCPSSNQFFQKAFYAQGKPQGNKRNSEKNYSGSSPGIKIPAGYSQVTEEPLVEYPQPTREQLLDLSKYSPYYDFGDDTTLPGGNPYGKQNLSYAPLLYKNDSGYIESTEEVRFTENLGITLDTFKKLRKKVLVLRRTSNMTAKGKIPSMNVLVVVGNGSGGGGYGEAKNDEVGSAVKKATERAIKNMIQFDRYDGRTIYHDIEHKFKATRLKLFARPPGFGVRTNHNIHEVCHCLGITDLAGKVLGSCNPMNVIKAFFDALLTQKTPGSIAKSRGKKIVDVQFQYYGVKTKYEDY